MYPMSHADLSPVKAIVCVIAMILSIQCGWNEALKSIRDDRFIKAVLSHGPGKGRFSHRVSEKICALSFLFYASALEINVP